MEDLSADIFGRKDAANKANDKANTTTAMPDNNLARIKVVGVGGGGGNAIERMIKSGLSGVEFYVMNTDKQVLDRSSVKDSNRLQIGAKLTNGLGAGGDPSIGEKAAEEAQQEITAALEGADMVFVTAGMGGGTGTGAAPVIAKIAKDLGILTVAVVTKPFVMEGNRRMAQANQGLEKLKDAVDSLLVIPNEKLFEVANNKTGVQNAFVIVDEVLLRGVEGISNIITKPGLINVDFADVKSVMQASGSAVMGIGVGEGEGRAVEAAKIAINSSLLETSIQGASGLIVNVTGGSDMSLFEVHDAIMLIKEAVLDDAQIIIGTTIDDTRQGEISITVIATGFDLKSQPSPVNLGGAKKDSPFPNIDTLFGSSSSSTGSSSKTGGDINIPSFNTSASSAGSSAQPAPSPAAAPKPFNTPIDIPPFLKK